MPRHPPVSKAELEIARVLWSLGEATPRQVYEAYPKKKTVDFATVQTYLRRLEAKGYLSAKLEGRTNVYRPRVRPKQVVREVVEDLIDRLFDGEALPLVQHLIEDRGLSGEEIRRLRRMIRQLESKKDG